MATTPNEDVITASGPEGSDAGGSIRVYGQGRIMARPYPVPVGRRASGPLARREAAQTVNAWFEALTESERDMWDVWAETHHWYDEAEFIEHRITTYSVYANLALKLLEVAPESAMLRLPSYDPFPEKPIELAAMAYAGQILWESSLPTPPNVVLELLVQSLRSPYRNAYSTKFRSLGFAAFPPNALVHATALRPGWYGLAFRAVHTETGQMSSLYLLPRFFVG